jgi:hypothetical protein
MPPIRISHSLMALLLGPILVAATLLCGSMIDTYTPFQELLALMRPASWSSTNYWLLWPILALEFLVHALVGGGTCMFAVAWYVESWTNVSAKITAISAAVTWGCLSVVLNNRDGHDYLKNPFWGSLLVAQLVIMSLIVLSAGHTRLKPKPSA